MKEQKEEKEEQDSQGTLSTRTDGRRLQWVPSVKKGARGGGAGPAPSPGGRGRGREKTLRGGSGGSERQLSGHRGPSCACCPIEDEATARAVTRSLRSQARGAQN